MSVSDNSTLLVVRDNEGSYQLLEGQSYGVGDLSVNSYEKSPYTDSEIISLDVGPTQTRYRVHRAIISQSPELDAKPAMKLWGEKTNNTISLPELDETTAHTLVHFLYTGRYQTLQSYDQAEKSAIPRYKLGTCVYCAAIRYKLPGLAELAKEKITSFGEDLNIFEILGVARESAFPLLPDDETWFPAYLEDAIKGAVSEDPDLFMKPGFVDQIEGDRKYRQVVIKAMLNTRAPTVSSPQPRGIQSPTVEAIAEEPSQDEVPPEETELQPAEAIEETQPTDIVAPSEEVTKEPEPVIDNIVKLDEIEPTLASPEAPEPFTDELGFGNSKTYQNMSKKPEEEVKADVVVDTATSKPAHTRSDSVMQVEQVTPAVPKEESVAASPEPTDVAPLIVDGTNVDTPLSKKAKKKMKKKAAAAAAAN